MRGSVAMPAEEWRPYLYLVIASVCAAVGQVLFKVGAMGREHWQDYLNVPLMVGLASYGAGTLLWILALSKVPLKVVYPFTVLTFVLVYAGAALVLGERLSVRGIVGMIVVLAGLAIIVSESGAQ